MVIPDGYGRVSTALLSMGIFLLILILCSHNINLSRLTNFIGNNTLGIYLIHMLWLLPVSNFLHEYALNIEPSLWTFCEIVIVLILSVLSTKFLKSAPLLKKIV